VTAAAFAVATALAVVVTPHVRRLALASGFVDQPGHRKVHAEPVPYLGGIPIILGTLAAALLGRLSGEIAVALLAATALGCVGLIDDHRSLGSKARLAIAAAIATSAYFAGVHAHVTGVGVIDAVLTVVWIVGIANAVNLLDNMDGLAGGVSAIAAGAVAILASAAGQQDVGRVAAGLAGATLGFLVYNRRPARIFMGDAGSLFLGFLLAVVVLDVDPNLTPPASFGVPLLLLALPVLDTTLVTIARTRHGRAIDEGGKDHLSHRLVKHGQSPGTAVWLLLVVELLLAIVAVAAGRTILPLPLAAVAGATLIGLVAVGTASAQVYEEPVVGLPIHGRTLAGLAVLAVLGVAGPAAVGMFAARRPAEEGAHLARAALTAAETGDLKTAAARFEQADAKFARAHDSLSGPLQSLGRMVPVLNSNIRAATELVEVGTDLSRTERRLATTLDMARLHLNGGRLDLAEVRRVEPALRELARSLRDGSTRLRAAEAPYLTGQIDGALKDFEVRIGRSVHSSELAARAARLAPDLLGARGTRRYFLAVQDSAELRGTGGLITHFGELVAEDGRLRLARWGSLDELRQAGTPVMERDVVVSPEFRRQYGQILDLVRGWTYVNASPDFPTFAKLVRQLYPQSGGTKIDGVIAIDTPGLRALLGVTGPIAVDGATVPLTADNVLDAPSLVSGPDRNAVNGETSRRTWEALTTEDVGDPRSLAKRLYAPTRQRHVQATFFRRDEAGLFRDLGASGAWPLPPGDALGVVVNNGSGTEVDSFVGRAVTYEAVLTPGNGLRAEVDARVDLRFHNRPPSSPPGALALTGDPALSIKPGQNVSLVSVASPLRVRRASLGGEAVTMTARPERGLTMHSGLLGVQSGKEADLSLRLTGDVALDTGGWYTLDLLRQPTLSPDDVSVRIVVPRGWRIVEQLGFDDVRESRAAIARFPLGEDRHLRVKLERDGPARLWDKLRGRWRA
jgi:UDP-GlcNAc:undecaprenyl-phosphate GlcNAc-1-phosphate transferase